MNVQLNPVSFNAVIVKKSTLNIAAILLFIAVILFLRAYKNRGSEFVGMWQNASRDGDRFEIIQADDSFVCIESSSVLSPQRALVAAQLRNGGIEIHGRLGTVLFDYDKTNDRLIKQSDERTIYRRAE